MLGKFAEIIVSGKTKVPTLRTGRSKFTSPETAEKGSLSLDGSRGNFDPEPTNQQPLVTGDSQKETHSRNPECTSIQVYFVEDAQIPPSDASWGREKDNSKKENSPLSIEVVQQKNSVGVDFQHQNELQGAGCIAIEPEKYGSQAEKSPLPAMQTENSVHMHKSNTFAKVGCVEGFDKSSPLLLLMMANVLCQK